MACFHPLRAFKVPGGVSFSERDGGTEMWLPCNKCHGCKLDRSRHWATRCVHEARGHSHNCAITLTYADEYLPLNGSLDYSHFQDFLKRLRERLVLKDDFRNRWNFPISYFGCGEYGGKKGRPHFHSLLFGFDFADKKVWKAGQAGSVQYRSKLLESVWTYGHSTVGDMSFETAAYIARYCMDKVDGPKARKWYERLDESTGEITRLEPEFNFMSLKRPIGKAWFNRFGMTDVFPFDRVVMNGHEAKPPRYYDKLLSVASPEIWKEVKFSREERAMLNPEESTRRRLDAREAVCISNLSKFKRSLK